MDVDALRQALAGHRVDEAAAHAAQATIDGAAPDSITYFGAREASALTRLTDQIARTGASPAVEEAAALLGAMLERLRAFDAPAQPGWLGRLLGRDAAPLSGAMLAAAETELDAIAARLEGFSNPLLTEELTLERRRGELDEALSRLVACLAGGLAALDGLVAEGPRRDLRGRLAELLLARTVALQARGTLELLVANRRELRERCEFVLRHALPLWHRQAELVRGELRRSQAAARERLEAANADLARALAEAPAPTPDAPRADG